MIKLTTRNGMPGDPSNTIYLEERVYKSLVEWVDVLEDVEYPTAAISGK